MLQLLLKIVWQFFIKSNISFPYDPGTSLSGLFSRDMKYKFTQRLVRECSQQPYWMWAKARNSGNGPQQVNA